MATATSENVLQRQLNDARIHARGSDLSEVSGRQVRQGVDGALTVVRIRELRVVEGVKKLGAELDCLPLPNAGGLQDRKIEVELAWAMDNAGSAVTVQRAAGDDAGIRRRALCLAGSGGHGVINRAAW